MIREPFSSDIGDYSDFAKSEMPIFEMAKGGVDVKEFVGWCRLLSDFQTDQTVTQSIIGDAAFLDASLGCGENGLQQLLPTSTRNPRTTGAENQEFPKYECYGKF